MKKILFLSCVILFSSLRGMEKEETPTTEQSSLNLSSIDPAVLDLLLNEGHNIQEFLAQQNFAMNTQRGESKTTSPSYQVQEEGFEEKRINRRSENKIPSELSIFFKNELQYPIFLKLRLVSDNYRLFGYALSEDNNENGYLGIASQCIIQCCYNPMFKLRCFLSRTGNKDEPQQHTIGGAKDILCLIRKNPDESKVSLPFRLLITTEGPEYKKTQENKHTDLYKLLPVIMDENEEKSENRDLKG